MAIVSKGEKMSFTPEEAERFHNRGRDIVTKLAEAIDEFHSYARVFEIRGGALGMGEAYGADTERFVVLRNDLNAFLGSEDNYRQNLLDKFRTDY